MPMKNPLHPGLLVKDCLEELGLGVADAAGILGLAPSQLDELIAGCFPITSDLAERLEKTVGSTAGTWLRMQKLYEIAHADAP